MPELTPQQRKQLDSNIRNMLAQGATEGDIMQYARDFNAKYNTPVLEKKKEDASNVLSVVGSKIGSPRPPSPKDRRGFYGTIDEAVRGGISTAISNTAIPEETKIKLALSGVKQEKSNIAPLEETVDVFENDPVRTMWTPVQNKIVQKRNAPVVESIQQSPIQKGFNSEENTRLLHERKQIEQIRFSNEAEAGNFIISVADPSKLRLKAGVDMTKRPTISDYDWNSVIDAMPKDNMTVAAALKQLDQTKNAKNAIATSNTIKDAAVKYAMMQNNLQGDQVRVLEGYVPESMKGNLVLNAINDPDFAEVIASNPDLVRQANDEIIRFADKYPAAGVRIIAEAISNYREDSGRNNALLNIPSAKVSDSIVEELVSKKMLPKQFAEFYKRPEVRAAVNLSLKTPGFVENFGKSMGETFIGMGQSAAELTGIRGLYKSGDDKLYSELDKQYSEVLFKPGGLVNKIGMFGGQITGQVLNLGATGNLMRLSGLVKGAGTANMISMGLQTFGSNMDRARTELPGAHWTTKLGYSIANTGIEMALANIFNDARFVRNLVKTQSPAIRTVITKFTNKEITEAAAKSAINDIYSRLVQFGKGMGNVIVPETIEESATELLQIANNQVFGGEPISVTEASKRVFEVAETTFLGSGVLGVAGGIVKSKSVPTTAAMLLQMASAPQKYTDIINGESAINPEYGADVDEKLDNLAFIAETKRQLDQRGVSEAKQGRFILASLKARILQKQAAATTFKDARSSLEARQAEPTATIQQMIKEAEVEQKAALTDDPVQIGKEFFENGLLNEIEAAAISNPDGSINEKAVIPYLETIAQQSNGFDSNWAPFEEKPGMPGVPEAIIELADKMFQDKIDAATQKQIVDAGLTIPKEIKTEDAPEVEVPKSAQGKIDAFKKKRAPSDQKPPAGSSVSEPSISVEAKNTLSKLDKIESVLTDEDYADPWNSKNFADYASLIAEVQNEFNRGRKEGEYLSVARKEDREFMRKDLNDRIAQGRPQQSVDQKPPAEKTAQGTKTNKERKTISRKIRDEKQGKKIADALDDFLKGGGLLASNGLDPERIEKGVRLIGLYLKSGVYKFSDIVEDLYDRLGEEIRSFMEAFKTAYSSYYNTQATDEEAAQMDAVVRGINLDDIIANLKTQTDDGGTTITDDRTGIPEPSGMAEGSAPGTVQGVDEGGAGSMGDQESGTESGTEGGPDETRISGGPGTGDNAGQSDVPLNGNDKINEDLGGHSEKQEISKPKDQEPVVSPLQHNGNFVIPPDFVHNRSFNVAQKLQDNIDAIRVLIKMDEEGRDRPTYEEQKTLFKYVGWGGIKEIAFDPDGGGWVASNSHLKPKIKEALEAIRGLDPAKAKENIAAVRSSILNAHYTAIPVIRGIWNVLRKGGFRGGTVLEPSAGVGHFIGAMPIDMVEKSRVGAIELDNITSRILKGLYPNHIIKNDGYQNVHIGNNSVDLVISNIPFGDYSVFDENFIKSKDPVLKKSTKKIHSYFFARAIQDVKPGGLIAFVTSTGIMDAKGNRDLRQMMADRVEFLGAIRLPNDTFQGNANTAVTTDIIFLRKFEETEKAEQRHNFLDGKKATATHKNRDEKFTVTYNEYFHDNPEMILGEVRAGSMYGASMDGINDAMTVIPKGDENIEEAITRLAPKIFSKEVKVSSGITKDGVKDRATAVVERKGERAGNIVEISNGVYGVFTGDEDENGKVIAEPIRVASKYAKAVKDMIGLRQALNELYASEIGDLPSEVIEEHRNKLNEAYKTFVKNSGTLQANKLLIERDIDGYNMLALENIEGKKVVGLADIFTKRVFKPKERATKAADLSEAIVINLNETGNVDINRVAELLGISPEEAIKKSKGVLFKNPEGGFETKDKYLSGNVRKKLEDAKTAAAEDPFYEDNVKALEEVQPADLNAAQIYAPISAAWINPKYISQFASQLFKQDVKITRLNTGKVVVDGGKGYNTAVSEEYGTSRMNGFKLLEEALQNRIPIVKDYFEDAPPKVNELETQKAIEKFEKIRQAFDSWIWQDDERRNDLVSYYNNNFNNVVVRKYDGSHLNFAGYAGELTPMPHQLDGAWMIMQQMGGILDHIVGSGKTLLMVLTAQKMKEMGLIKKPIILGLKANTADLAARYRKSFPLAKVLSPTERDFTPENRRAFFAKMANNDWDAIIMTHDQFGKIPQSVEMQREIIQEEIDALIADVATAKNQKLSKRDISGLEKRIANLKTKLLTLAAMDKDKSLKDFEQMGIDFMFVDESQQFKNLTYSTLQRGVAGLGDPKGSNKAFNMLVATRALQKVYGADKGTVFASGTPISNTMVEMYLLFKYLRPNKMAELGINTFDQWANTFARVGSEIEFGVTNSLKPKTRMRDFMNVPEMSAMYREIADVRNDSNLDLPKPKFKKTVRVKTNKNLPAFSTVSIGDKKFKVIGRIKGVEKDEFWVSLKAIGKDSKLPASGVITHEGQEINYSDTEYSDGLLINVPPTIEQRKFAKRIQKFAESKGKEGHWIGRPGLSEGEEKAFMLLATNLASKMAIDMRLVDPSYPSSEDGKIAIAADTILDHYNESTKHKGIQLVFSDLGTPKTQNTAENLFNLIESRGVVRDTLEDIFGVDAYHQEKPKYPKLTEIRERLAALLEYSDIEIDEAITEANEDNFNVYQELKDKLVKRGIPAEEIAFIHDYKSDKQKQALFEDAIAGKVRVIIGSTSKLGTGVNVQKKIVAMHHLDVPWRPSDMEQRNGRGIRQGNKIIEQFYDNELPIYMYATEATLDAYKYQLLATKQQFIDQAKTGDATSREISEGEGDEESGVSFAAMTAMLSGNPVILEKAKVDKKVKELETSYKAFEQEKYSLKDKITRDVKNIERVNENVANLKSDKELFEQNVVRNEKTGEFEYIVIIDGKEYQENQKREKGDKTVRQRVGEAIISLKKKYKEEATVKRKVRGEQEVTEVNKHHPEKQIGTIYGFDIVLKPEGNWGDIGVGVKSKASGQIYEMTKAEDDVHIASHLLNSLKELGSKIKDGEREADVLQKDKKDKETYLKSLPAEFPKKTELEAALEQQKRVTELLREMTNAAKVPTQDELEAIGYRLIGPPEDFDIDSGNVYALTEDNIVMRVMDRSDLNEAVRLNSIFYEYKEETGPGNDDDTPDDYQVKEEAGEEVREMRGIVKEFVEAGHTNLESLKKTIAKELDDNSTEMMQLVEEAYFEFSKEKVAASPNVVAGVIERVQGFVDDLLGGDVVVMNENDLKQEAAGLDGVSFMKSPEGVILGFTQGNTIYLNGQQLNPNTPVHEAGHLWMLWAEKNFPMALEIGTNLVTDSRYLQKVKGSPVYQREANKLPESDRELYYRKEALASAIGDKGAQFVLENKKKGFAQWLASLWDAVKKVLRIKDATAKELESMSLNEFAKRVSGEILSGPQTKPSQQDEDVSGIKKALVSPSTVKSVSIDRLKDDELINRGRELIASGEVKPEAVVNMIITDGRGVLTPEEVAALIAYKRGLDNDLQDAYKRWNASIETGKPVGTAGVEIASIEQKIHDYEIMSVITAQQQSLAFRLRKKLLDSGFNIVTAIERYKKNNDGQIPADVLEKFEAADRKIKQLEAKLNEERQAFQKAEEERAMRDIQEAIAREEEIERRISEGVEGVVNGLYKTLEPKKKKYADRALDALAKIKRSLRGRTYDATLGIPVAILDAGITTIEYAIKAGKEVAEAIEIGISKIKQLLNGKPFDKEDEFRQIMTDGFTAAGIKAPRGATPTVHADGTITIPARILRDMVKSGIDTIEELTEAVKELLIKDFPGVTDRQVRDFITGYGKQINPTQDEIAEKLAELKRVGRLLSELEDLEIGKLKTKNVDKLKRITDREIELKGRIRALSDMLIATTPPTEAEIRKQQNDRMNSLRQQIATLEAKLKLGHFSKNKKPKPTNEEILELEAQLQTIKDEVEREQEKVRLKNRPWTEKLIDYLLEIMSGLPRALVASLDFSATLVQGIMQWFINPKASLKALGESFRQFFSAKREEKYITRLRVSDHYPLLKASGLPIGETNVKLSVKEGIFFLNLVNHLYDAVVYGLTLGYKPWTNAAKQLNPFKASQRAYEGYLNHLRVSIFLNDAKIFESKGYTFENNPEIFKQLAANVGTTTGRAQLGRRGEQAKWLDIVFFSMRKLVSEVKLFTPLAFIHYAKMPRAVRHKALLDFAKFVTYYVVVNGGIWAMRKDWDDDDEEDHFWDPTSTDFLTHKINGTRLGIGTGMKSILVFQGRFATGKFTDQNGVTSNLGERYGKEINSRLDLGVAFLLNKLAPGPAIIVAKADETKGRKMSDKETIERIVLPMWLQDVDDLYKTHPTEIAAMLNALSILGIAVRAADEKAPVKGTKTPRHILDARKNQRAQLENIRNR